MQVHTWLMRLRRGLPSEPTRQVRSWGIQASHWIGGTPMQYLSTASASVFLSSKLNSHNTWKKKKKGSVLITSYTKNTKCIQSWNLGNTSVWWHSKWGTSCLSNENPFTCPHISMNQTHPHNTGLILSRSRSKWAILTRVNLTPAQPHKTDLMVCEIISSPSHSTCLLDASESVGWEGWLLGTMAGEAQSLEGLMETLTPPWATKATQLVGNYW